jgi:hypothetical protein
MGLAEDSSSRAVVCISLQKLESYLLLPETKALRTAGQVCTPYSTLGQLLPDDFITQLCAGQY